MQLFAPPVTPEQLYLQDKQWREWGTKTRKTDREIQRARARGTLIHMQNDLDKFIAGTPIHYVSGGRGNRYATTSNPDSVTCKMCLRMLERDPKLGEE